MDEDQAARLNRAEDTLARLAGIVEVIDERLAQIEAKLSGADGDEGPSRSAQDGRRAG